MSIFTRLPHHPFECLCLVSRPELQRKVLNVESVGEKKSISILPLGAAGLWAINHDVDVHRVFGAIGLNPLDFVDGERFLTPSHVAYLWQAIDREMKKKGILRVGLHVANSIPFDMFQNSSVETDYLGMESILYSETVHHALERYAKFLTMRHIDASLRVAIQDDRVAIIWNLGKGDPGPDHADYSVAVVVSALNEALGRQLPILRAGLGSDSATDETRQLFGDAELVSSASIPFIEISRTTFQLALSDAYPVVGGAIDRRLGRIESKTNTRAV